MSGSVVSDSTNTFLAQETVRPARLIRMHDFQGISGLLHDITHEGRTLMIAHIGDYRVILPDEPIKTKGGKVDLKDWIGRKICLDLIGNVYSTRLQKDKSESVAIRRIDALASEGRR